MIPFLFGLLLFFSAARAEELAMIVNSQNSINTISQTQVSDFFLKKAKQWPGGTTVRFFDRSDTSELRKSFIRSYIHKSSRDIELYWIGQKLYSGLSAPSQLSSDNMTEIMVSRFSGAIGYVSKEYEITRPVKKISVTEP